MIRILILTLISAFAQAKLDWSNIKPVHPEVLPTPLQFSRSFSRHLHNNRIVGGQEAERNSIPFQVALFLHTESGTTNFCGGSLISQKFILTAAHCAILAKEITAYLGAHNITVNEPTQVRINSTKFIIHEEYDPEQMLNDIALVELLEPIQLTNEIDIVKLPRYSDVENCFVGKTATVSGWGKISDKETAISDVLYYTNSFVLTTYDCNIYFFGFVQDTHICIDGEEYRSPCSGDSGGPLIYDNKQIGIVSFGSAFGCQSGFPGAFTRLTSQLQWIEDNSDVVIEK